MIESAELQRLRAFTPADLADSSKCSLGAHRAQAEIGGSLACIEAGVLLIDTPQLRHEIGSAAVIEDFSAICRVKSVCSLRGTNENMLALYSQILHVLDFNVTQNEHPIRAAEHIISAATIRRGAVYIPVLGLSYYAPIPGRR